MTKQNRVVFANAVLAAAAIFATASHPQAGFISIIQQVGNDVVVTGSGTINLSALTSGGGGTNPGGIFAGDGVLITSGRVSDYSSISGPGSFGSGTPFTANSHSGDPVGIDGAANTLYVPDGYISGSALSDTSTFTSNTLAGLGLTTGVYTWTWGSGATADSFQLDIGGSSTPEASTFGLLALAAGGLMLGCRFRRGPAVMPVGKMDAACSSPSGRISPTEL